MRRQNALMAFVHSMFDGSACARWLQHEVCVALPRVDRLKLAACAVGFGGAIGVRCLLAFEAPSELPCARHTAPLTSMHGVEL
jgi:hypothetical protein